MWARSAAVVIEFHGTTIDRHMTLFGNCEPSEHQIAVDVVYVLVRVCTSTWTLWPLDTGTDGRTQEWQTVLLCVRVFAARHEPNLILLSLFVVELVLPFVHPLDEHHSTTIAVAVATTTVVIVVICCWHMLCIVFLLISSERFIHRLELVDLSIVFCKKNALTRLRLMRMHCNSISNYHVAKQLEQTLFQWCCATAGRRQSFVYIFQLSDSSCASLAHTSPDENAQHEGRRA